MLSDGAGTPVGVAVAGANRNDHLLLDETLQSIPVERPEPDDENPQHLCLDKGDDYPRVEELVEQWGYTAHIRRRGEDDADWQPVLGYRARRWVVERMHSWLNRFRRLLIRWEKKIENYVALVHLACAYFTYRQAGVLG